MPNIDITINAYGIEIPMRVTYDASPGRPATRWEPEEFPELDIHRVVLRGTYPHTDITEDLTEDEWSRIDESVEQALSTNYDGEH